MFPHNYDGWLHNMILQAIFKCEKTLIPTACVHTYLLHLTAFKSPTKGIYWRAGRKLRMMKALMS